MPRNNPVDGLISTTHANRLGEPATITDALFDIADAIDAIRYAARHLGTNDAATFPRQSPRERTGRESTIPILCWTRRPSRCRTTSSSCTTITNQASPPLGRISLTR